MNVGIIDADLIGRKKHRFPNLVCMKLSAWYKNGGGNVELLTKYENLDDYDKVFIAKVFTDTPVPEWVLKLKNVEYNGTGFFYDKATPLPTEIEHMKPDYHLYDEWLAQKDDGSTDFLFYKNTDIGFTTRGCFRHCPFCVNKNYNAVTRHSHVDEFLTNESKRIILLDDNVLGCGEWRSIFEELQSTGKPFQFKQGMDERLLTDDKAKLIFASKWYGDYYFAFDHLKDADLIESKLAIAKKYTDKWLKFYTLCGFDYAGKYDHDFWVNDIFSLMKRIQILMKWKCSPYVTRFYKYKESPYSGVIITVARWANQSSFYKKQSLMEFAEANGMNSSSAKYLHAFENMYPEIKTYFDMKIDGVGARKERIEQTLF